VSNPSAVACRLRIAELDVAVEIAQRRPCLRLQIGDPFYTVVENLADAGAFELTVNGVVYRGWRYVTGKEVHVRLGARTFVVSRTDAGPAATGAATQHYEVRADMPGVVVAVHCEVGQAVATGDPLVTIESMKLQATLVASREAVVERVHVDLEAAFERGVVLVSFARPSA
jgi:acetyl/propionyl-CoA carboxylase alpha subunit